MFVINSADVNGFFNIFPENLALVNYKGIVKLTINLSALRTRCKMNYYKFPYDVQSCEIIIGSWQHNADRIDFDADDGDIDTSMTLKNNIWNLASVNIGVKTAYVRFPVGQNGTEIVYKFELERRPKNFMLNNIFPTLVIGGVTIMSFFFRYAQQCTISMNVFLALAIYSVRISSEFASQSEYIPLVSIYFMLGILFTFFALCWFVCKELIGKRDEIPKPLNIFANFIRKIFKRTRQVEVKSEPKSEENTDSDKNSDLKKPIPEPVKHELCNKCDSCMKCLNEKDKEKIKKKIKEEKEANVNALNLFMLFVIFTCYFVSYLVIWLLIVT